MPSIESFDQAASSNPAEDQTFSNVYSAEEIKALRECNTESFYFRSLPISTALSATAYFLMSRGKWKKSPRFGYTPKMMGMGILGYLIGKVSYTTVCIEKFMRLPDSKIGEALRKRRGISTPNQESTEGIYTTSIGIDEKPIFDDHRPDLRDHNEGAEQYHRVTESLSEYMTKTEKQERADLDYADLRKQNRDAYMQKVGSTLHDPPSPSTYIKSMLPTEKEQKEPEPEKSFSPPPRKNKYGDIID